MRRNNLSYSEVTHRAQQNNRTKETSFIEAIKYLNNTNVDLKDYDQDCIEKRTNMF